MIFASDRRGQSLQVGAVLLFGFLILAGTIFQAKAVPEENKQVEFDHSQQVADEMVVFYNAVFETVTTGEPRTAEITLGTDYNNRLFFIYPPPATGTLRTTDGSQLQLHNVTAIEDPGTNNSFDNFWRNETRNYTTRAITYSPNYRELRGTAEYRIEYGILAAEYPELTRLRLADRHEPIIDRTEINIIMFDGELQEVSPDTESVIPERVTESTTITVTNATNTSSLTLELPTGLTEDNWNTSNPDSVLYNQPNVDNVSVNGGIATVQLDGTKNYSLTLHKVDIGSNPTEPSPTYIRNVSYDGTNATFQIRDEYNDHIDETVEVGIYNTSYQVNETISVSDGQHTFVPDPDDCGVSLRSNVSKTEPYERLNITGRC
jgi:hypothetical protein